MTTTTNNSKKTPSEIYFSTSSSTKENSSYYYTHQNIKVSLSRSSSCSSSSSSSNNDDSKNNVVHGRGLIATRDIQPGELLFITPPTLNVDTDILRQMYFSEKRGESQNVSKKIINLEKLAMRLLENKMMDTTEVLVEFDEENSSDEKNLGVLNSFLALMSGSHDNTKVEDILQSIDDSASASYIDVLNAKYSSTIWAPEELQSLFSRKSKKEIMKNIILKNAFGPDFITYDKIQYKWDLSFNQDSNIDDNDDNFPPHILGIFPLASMINHSCIPNAIRTFSSNGSIMICHASQKIKAGDEIVWSYIPPTLPFMERRRTLKKRHGFVCKCQRCLSESKFFSNQNLFPSLLKSALKDGMKYNQTMLNFSSSESSNYQEMEKCIKAYQSIEDHLFSHDSADNNVITNELKRYLRVGFTNLHFNYFNSVLSLLSMMGAGNVTTTKEQQTQHQAQQRQLVLNSATQLHFSFCSSNNACTEHLSLLHLCYELSNSTSALAIDAETAKKKIKFWTEQMKRTHMIRYGDMENNLETVRKCLVHTRSILRQQNGFLRMKHNFL